MPSSEGRRGRPWRDHRQVLEGIIYRFRTGIAWRDLPEEFGPWQTVWERHQTFSTNGTYDKIHARLLTEADAVGDLDWMVSVDSTINRAHQHATNTSRVEQVAGDSYAARSARAAARHTGAAGHTGG
jgi:transposase